MRLTHRVLPCAVLALLLPIGVPPFAAGPPATGPQGVIAVEASYPGANAQVVADTLAAPIEQQINGVENMLRMISRSSNDGTYRLHVTFKPGIDMDIAQVLVQNRVSLALPTVPTEVQRAGINVTKIVPGVLLSAVLYTPDDRYDVLYLSNYAQIYLRDELGRMPGVGDVTLFGGSDLGLCIQLDPERLAARGLTAADVLKALREQNGLKAEQFADVIVKASENRPVRLKDVAGVEVGGSRPRSFAFLDGKPVVALGLFSLPKAHPREIIAGVRKRMDKLKEAFPAGLDYFLSFDLAQAQGASQPTLGFLRVDPVLPAGLSSERAARLVERCGKVLIETHGVKHVLALSQNPSARFLAGPCLLAMLSPDMKHEERERLVRTLRSRLDKIKEAEWRLCDLAKPGGQPLGGYHVDLAIRGPEAKSARELAEKLVERLARIGKRTDVAVSPESRAESQFLLDIDRTTAATSGVSMADIINTMQIYLGSADVGQVNEFGRSVKVQLQMGPQGLTAAEGLKQLKVRTNEGQMVALARCAKVREVTGPQAIDRLDLMPMAEITANPHTGLSLAEARWLCETQAEEVRKKLYLPATYQLVWLQQLPAAKLIPGARKPEEPDAGPPEVPVSKPVEREVTDYEDFTGRTEAVERVDLKARVTGYLIKTPFREGDSVKQGDLLFEIDPRPYQAQLDQVQSQVGLAEAQLKLARATQARDLKVNETAPGSVAPQQLDQDRASVEEADARVKAARAGTESAKLNLEFCPVTAPIDGQVGRFLITPGNLVLADQTSLTTIVSLDPMYVYFDMDERTLLRLRRAARDGRIKPLQEGKIPVLVG